MIPEIREREKFSTFFEGGKIILQDEARNRMRNDHVRKAYLGLQISKKPSGKG
jgi:ABC-type lipopolysaccharide export system ATPase subunit